MDPAEGGFDEAERQTLLEIARRSLAHAVRSGSALPLKLGDYGERLRARRAVFVTLHKEGALRGCVGSLEAVRPLVEDVAECAFRAGFHDPRFAALREDELAALEIHLSVLTPLEPFPVTSEEDLIAKLRPGVDGLMLRDGSYQATFLPAVWETVPDPAHFVRELKRKAGMREDHWSNSVEVFRYTTVSIG